MTQGHYEILAVVPLCHCAFAPKNIYICLLITLKAGFEKTSEYIHLFYFYSISEYQPFQSGGATAC